MSLDGYEDVFGRVGGLGDLIRFDILGRVIEARVTSLRNVEWADARAGGFMFVFRPGVLDAAPQTFIEPLGGSRWRH